MRLGVKVHQSLFDNSIYREHLNKFDVWYVNSDIYSNLDKLDEIYQTCYDNGKEMYGYYLFSSRMFFPRYNKLPEMRNYAKNIINRYPLINSWEICHEAIDDNGIIRKNHQYDKNIGKGWEQNIYRIVKNEYPDKKLYYSDYIRGFKKADSVIKFVNNTKHIDGFNFQCHSDIVSPISSRLIDYIYKEIEKDIVSLENVVWQLKRSMVDAKSPKKVIRDMSKNGFVYLLNIKPEIMGKIQAYRYKQYYKLAAKNNISVFGLWCLSDIKPDKWNYLPWHDNPGLLDINLIPKECYKSFFS